MTMEEIDDFVDLAITALRLVARPRPPTISAHLSMVLAPTWATPEEASLIERRVVGLANVEGIPFTFVVKDGKRHMEADSSYQQ